MLRFVEEILLLLLRDEDEDGKFLHVPRMSLNHAIAGGVLMDLAMENRIDSDLENLILIDSTPVGDSLLDPTLAEIAAGEQSEARFWVEHTAKRADAIREEALSRLVAHGILERHDDRFLWVFRSRRYPAIDGKVEREVKLRIMGVLFSEEIPDPRDIVIICLADVCGIFGQMLSRRELDQASARIEQVRKLDLIGQAMFAAIHDIEKWIAAASGYGKSMAADQPMPSTKADEPAVTVTDAVFRYGTQLVLDRSSFVVPAGTVTALIGPNGAGKSTMLNGIAGLVTPVSGRVIVGKAKGRSLRISYVLQDTKVNQSLPVTVREVVSMGRYADKGLFRPLSRLDRRLVNEAMERTDISHLAKRHLSQLSGGERHRVLLAQGLVQDHDILLLDEPATGLDLVSIQAIRETIREENAGGCTVVLPTHDLAEAWTAHHIVLLAGRVVTSGPPRDVLKTSHLTEAYGAGLLGLNPPMGLGV